MKQRFTSGRQFDQDFTMILIAMTASHGSLIHESIHKFHRRVMAKAESLSERGYGGTIAFRQTLDCQKKLMLLGLDTPGTGGLFADMQKSPDMVSEVGKPSNFFV